MSGIHIHTLQKQLCLNYNSLGVLIHLAERRVHDDIIYASYDGIFHAIYAGAAEQIRCVGTSSEESNSTFDSSQVQ